MMRWYWRWRLRVVSAHIRGMTALPCRCMCRGCSHEWSMRWDGLRLRREYLLARLNPAPELVRAVAVHVDKTDFKPATFDRHEIPGLEDR